MREEGLDKWKDFVIFIFYDIEYIVKNFKIGKEYYFVIVAENKVGFGDVVEIEFFIILRKKLGMFFRFVKVF